jgi:hypothetical protein
MSRVLWKEYREQRSVWLTLALLAVLALVIPASVFAPHGWASESNLLEALRVVALVLAWTHGLVCGAMLLAGEREAGTLTFLDTLPVPRANLWRRKALSGALFVLAQVAVLGGLGIGLGLVEAPVEVAAGLLFLTVLALAGFAWGLLFSATTRTAMGAIGLALAAQFVAGHLLLLVAFIVSRVLALFLGIEGASWLAFLLAVVAAIGLPLIGSALVFGKPDRLRGPAALSPTGIGEAGPLAAWRSAWWLSARQARGLALALLPVSLLLGLAVPTNPLFLWPLLTLIAGALCGVTAFFDEQQGGSFRFLAEQRFPLAPLWVCKFGLRLALAFAAAFALLLPCLALALFGPDLFPEETPFGVRLFRSGAIGHFAPLGTFLTLGLLYGFGFGSVCGLLFRKPLVALVVSLGAGALAVCLWLPSLLGTGLHAWQPLGVPMLLIALAVSLVRPAAAGRLASWSVAGRIALASLLASAWTTGAIAYRVYEVPDVPEPPELAKYEASLPTPEDNVAGGAFRAACLRVDDLMRQARQERPSGPVFPGQDRPRGDALNYEAQMSTVLERGWPDGPEPDLGRWLDKLFKESWADRLGKVADRPAGVIEDPRRLTVSSPARDLDGARALALLLAVRGLQEQARGNDRPFVENLRIGLALARNLANRSTLGSLVTARHVERVFEQALERWLERLHGGPALLRDARDCLVRHEATVSDDFSDQQSAAYLIARNSLDVVDHWALTGQGPAPLNNAQTEQAVVRLAWLVPWERARQERLLRAAAWGNSREVALARHMGREVLFFWPNIVPRAEAGHRRRVCYLRVAQIQVALRLYQAVEHKPAPSLAVLVPGCLSDVPRDPFAKDQPFRYRLSVGEEIEWPREGPGPGGAAPPGVGPPGGAAKAGPPLVGMPGAGQQPPAVPRRKVPAGQGILWSVGEDGSDDGGKRQAKSSLGQSVPGEDLIFLVPLPPR